MVLLDLKRLSGGHLKPYRRIGEDEPVPERGAILAMPERCAAEGDTLAGRADPVGLLLSSDARLEDLSVDPKRFPLIAIEIEKFNDGRIFSLAWRLRQQWDYEGEIRAVGKVIADFAGFLLRAGVSSVELEDARVADSMCRQLGLYGVWYQDALDARPTALELRHGRTRRRLAS